MEMITGSGSSAGAMALALRPAVPRSVLSEGAKHNN
jgi:hypothetical protein